MNIKTCGWDSLEDVWVGCHTSENHKRASLLLTWARHALTFLLLYERGLVHLRPLVGMPTWKELWFFPG